MARTAWVKAPPRLGGVGGGGRGRGNATVRVLAADLAPAWRAASATPPPPPWPWRQQPHGVVTSWQPPCTDDCEGLHQHKRAAASMWGGAGRGRGDVVRNTQRAHGRCAPMRVMCVGSHTAGACLCTSFKGMRMQLAPAPACSWVGEPPARASFLIQEYAHASRSPTCMPTLPSLLLLPAPSSHACCPAGAPAQDICICSGGIYDAGGQHYSPPPPHPLPFAAHLHPRRTRKASGADCARGGPWAAGARTPHGPCKFRGRGRGVRRLRKPRHLRTLALPDLCATGRGVRLGVAGGRAPVCGSLTGIINWPAAAWMRWQLPSLHPLPRQQSPAWGCRSTPASQTWAWLERSSSSQGSPGLRKPATAGAAVPSARSSWCQQQRLAAPCGACSWGTERLRVWAYVLPASNTSNRPAHVLTHVRTTVPQAVAAGPATAELPPWAL